MNILRKIRDFIDSYPRYVTKYDILNKAYLLRCKSDNMRVLLKLACDYYGVDFAEFLGSLTEYNTKNINKFNFPNGKVKFLEYLIKRYQFDKRKYKRNQFN